MSWTFLGQKRTKARKRHRCFSCKEAINPGDEYIKRSGVERGEGYANMHMHPECEQATHDWSDEDWETLTYNRTIRGTTEIV